MSYIVIMSYCMMDAVEKRAVDGYTGSTWWDIRAKVVTVYFQDRTAKDGVTHPMAEDSAFCNLGEERES
jgi:hypothetical protein